MAHEIMLNSNFGVYNKVVLEYGHIHSKAELGSCKRDHKIFTVWPYRESLLIVIGTQWGYNLTKVDHHYCCHHHYYFISSS